jgi:hypothetical protein
MVESVTIVAFVFALVFAIFLAWPSIWKLITVGYLSETGTGSAAGTKAGTKAGTGGGNSTAAKDSVDAAGGWSPLEIGGLVGGIAAFIAFVAIAVVIVRSRRGKPPRTADSALKDALKMNISGSRTRNVARGAKELAKAAGRGVGRNVGRAARFVASLDVTTNAELAKQKEELKEMGKRLEQMRKANSGDLVKFTEHILAQTEIFGRNVSKYRAKSNDAFEAIKKFEGSVVDAATTNGSVRGPIAGAEPVGKPPGEP